MASQSLKDRCLQIVQDLAREEGWQLPPQGIEALVEAILPFVQPASDPTDRKIRSIARNYRLDGPMVQEMLTQGSPDGERLWAEWRQYFVNVARAKGMYPGQAEDLVQDVYFQTSKALGTFRFECRLKTFRYSVFSHCYKQWVRDKKLRDDKEQLLIEGEGDNGVPLEPAIPNRSPLPEDVVVEQMQNAALRRLVEGKIQEILKSEDFQILYLYYVEETYIDEETGEKKKWTDKAIGQRLGMPRNTVTSKRHRALQRLEDIPKLRSALKELVRPSAEATDE